MGHGAKGGEHRKWRIAYGAKSRGKGQRAESRGHGAEGIEHRA